MNSNAEIDIVAVIASHSSLRHKFGGGAVLTTVYLLAGLIE